MQKYKHTYKLLISFILFFGLSCSKQSHLKTKELKTNQIQVLKQTIECPPHALIDNMINEDAKIQK